MMDFTKQRPGGNLRRLMIPETGFLEISLDLWDAHQSWE
jgi:hypothetical protein